MSTDNRTLLTIDEAAERVAVSVGTIRRWIADGVLPARRIGPRVIRIAADDLDKIGEPVAARP